MNSKRIEIQTFKPIKNKIDLNKIRFKFIIFTVFDFGSTPAESMLLDTLRGSLHSLIF